MTSKRKPRPRPKQKPLYETNYVVFSKTYGDGECALISREPDLPTGHDNWRSGRRNSLEIQQPLKYEIHEADEGAMIPFYNELGVPLISDELATALQSAGVNNLELYDAVISEVRTGTQYENYKAMNIVGLVRAADESSELKSLGLGGNEPLLSSWIDYLVVSEEKAKGLLMFRLAESVSTILIHKSVQAQLEASSIIGGEYLKFIHPAHWRG